MQVLRHEFTVVTTQNTNAASDNIIMSRSTNFSKGVFANNLRWHNVGINIAKGAQITAPTNATTLSIKSVNLMPRYPATKQTKNLDKF